MGRGLIFGVFLLIANTPVPKHIKRFLPFHSHPVPIISPSATDFEKMVKHNLPELIFSDSNKAKVWIVKDLAKAKRVITHRNWEQIKELYPKLFLKMIDELLLSVDINFNWSSQPAFTDDGKTSSSLNTKGGIDLQDTEVNMKNASSTLMFDIPPETIQAWKNGRGVRFDILKLEKLGDLNEFVPVFSGGDETL